MPLRLSFSTLACPDWTWYDVLERGPHYGYAGVEIRMLENQVNLLELKEFRTTEFARRRDELSAAGFRVCGLASSVRFDYATDEELQAQIGIGERYIDLARGLDAEFVRVFGDVLPPASDGPGRERVMGQIVAGLSRLGSYAAERHVQVLIETHGDFADTARLAQVLERVGNPYVGAVWDTHHPWRFFGEELAESQARLDPWIRHTHWKDSASQSRKSQSAELDDAEEKARQLMSGHRGADYVLLGRGEFPAAECLRLLRAMNYQGWYSLEWEKAWHPEIEPPDVALPQFAESMRRLWAEGSD